MTVAVRITEISHEIHGGHDLRVRAYRWDPRKLGFGEGVRDEGTRKKRWQVGGLLLQAHSMMGMCSLQQAPTCQGGRTIISIEWKKILRP